MMLTRRNFGILAGVGSLAVLLASCSRPGSPISGESGATDFDQNGPPFSGQRMPDEGDPHTATWMSLQVRDEIWGADLAPAVRDNLALIATTIASFEPVHALVEPGTEDTYDLPGVIPVGIAADDLWIRDTGPVFVTYAGGLSAMNFNFNGWGDQQEHDGDALVAEAVCADVGITCGKTALTLEGGALEVDGEGTAIITESCVLNDNRNPGWSKADVEAELLVTLGITHVIWLPGIAGRDITDGHTDFYARFASPGVVVAGRDDDPESFDHAVTRTHLDILATAKDAAGRSLDVHVLPGPSTIRPEFETDDFAAGYINFYLCNGAVIVPEFGDADADEHARATLAGLFPDREVVQLNIDPIAAGGGGIHCATQQQPQAK